MKKLFSSILLIATLYRFTGKRNSPAALLRAFSRSKVWLGQNWSGASAIISLFRFPLTIGEER
jgi:hypothetical protein